MERITQITERLPVWEKLLKRMVLEQLGPMNGMKILDFGSGTGVTASYFAENNEVIAIEPSKEILDERVPDERYTQLVGSLDRLEEMESGTFDLILCHNVLEYAGEREEIVREFYRLLKPGGKLSVVKHNRAGRVMQMAVLLNQFEHANELLDGKNCTASKFGEIRYYEDSDILRWCEGFELCSVRGIRTFWDLQQNQGIQSDPLWQKEMLALEIRVAGLEEYKAVAFFHHLILEKR